MCDLKLLDAALSSTKRLFVFCFQVVSLSLKLRRYPYLVSLRQVFLLVDEEFFCNKPVFAVGMLLGKTPHDALLGGL